jgi:hypothetical protein
LDLLDNQNIFRQDRFTCRKCGFVDVSGKELQVHSSLTLCTVCFKFAPQNEKQFKKYISEKIDSKLLNLFRSSQDSISKKTLTGMENLVKSGKPITRPPKGYKIQEGQFVIDELAGKQVQNIFHEFSTSQISLTQLAKKNSMTTSGRIKLLKNTTYLGNIKFSNNQLKGNHLPLISEQLFQQVQEKLKN